MPVAEYTARHGKGGRSAGAGCRAAFGRGGCALLLLLAPCFGIAGTLPTGGMVSAGGGSVAVAGNTMTVQQNTAKLAIEWQSYSIGAGSKVVYRQPGADSVALNRVLGGSRSEIYGAIEANGKVFLINPNGVLFGPGAEINVGGLVATTKLLSDADFMAGKYTFVSGSGENGEVINQGQLTATPGGFIVLAGRQVSNTGTINAPQGTVALAAGETVSLDIDSAGALKIRVDGAMLNALINNQGLIAADGGQVYLTARGKEMAQRSVINVEGIVQARSIGSRNGRIVIDGGADGAVVARDATIDISGLAAGETGGEVRLTGNYVGLFGTTTVDARGAAGGGTVLVGGDYQGGGDLAHAQVTVMGSAARIDASAMVAGNGGKVVLWSDGYTAFNGEIAARGASLAGDGGLVETSSRNNLQAFGKVCASAPVGQAGTWLLDPTNVTIVAGAANANDTDGGSGTWTPSATGAQIGASNINNELNAGTSVTINTTSGLAEAGDITVNAAIAKTAGANTSLTLNAAGSVVLNASITSTTGQLATTLNAAAGSLSGSGDLNVNGGLLTLNSATAGTLSGVISGSGSVTKSGSGVLTLSGANTYTGATNINAGTLQAGSSSALGSNSAVTMPNNVAATLDLNGNAIVIGSLTQTGGAGVGIVTNSSTTPATLTLGGNNSSTGYYGQIRDGASVPAGTISLVKQGSGTLTLADVTYTGSTTVAAGTLSIGGGGSIGSLSARSAVTVNSGATLAFNRNNTLTFSNAIGGAGNVANIGSGTTTLTGASTYTGTTTVSAGTLRFTQAAALYGGDTSKWTASQLIVNSGATLALSYGGVGEFNAAQLDLLKGLGSASGGFLSGSYLGIDTGSGSQTYGSVITNTNGGANTVGITKLGTNTLTLTGNNTYTGTTRISAGVLQVGNGGTMGTLGSGSVVESASTGLVFNRSDSLTVSNAISGTGTLTQNGSGILTLSGANTYSGATAINAGTVQAGSTTALGSNSALTLANAAGVTLDLNGRNLSIGSLAGGGTSGGTVTNGGAAATLTVGGNNSSTAFSGTLQNGTGTLAVTKTGSGTQTLSGNNSNTGATTVSAGTLAFSKTAALYGGNTANWTTGNLIVNSAATLAVNYGGSGEFTSAQIDLLKALGTAGGGFKSGSFLGIDTSSGDQTYASAITNPNAGANVLGLTKLGANTLTLSGTNTYTGATAVKAGTLSIGGGGTTGSLAAGSAVAVTSGATLAFNRSDALTFANVISGAGNVANNGSGTTTLSGTNSYSGSTTINAGGLKAGSASAFGSSSLSLASGSTLIDLNGFNLALGALTGSNGLVTNSGAAATLTVGNSASATFGGVIQDGSGMLSLVKVGTGTQTLTGNNTYTGSTTINAGTLAFGKTASLYNGNTSNWTANKLIVKSGSTLGLAYGGAGEFTAAQLDLLAGLGTATGGFLGGSALGIDTSSGSQTYASVIANTNGGSNAIGITKLGANTLTLTGANTFSGTTTVSGGTLQLGDGSGMTLGLGSGAVVNNASLAFDYNAPTTLANAMSGSGTFANIGTGRVTLSTALAATTDGNGNTTATVAGGTAGITFSSNKTINVQGKVTITSFNSGQAANTWIHSSAPGTEITIAGPAYAKWIGTSPDNPVYDSAANCLAWAPDIIVNAGASVYEPFNDRVSYIHNLSGVGDFAMDGRYGSSTYITGSSTLSGTITLRTKAVLQFGVGGAGGSAGATNIVASTSDNQVIFNSTSDATYSGAISGPATVVKNAGNTLTMTGNNSYAATIVNAGTLRVGAGGTTGRLGSGSVVDNAKLVFDRSDTVALSSVAASGASSGITGTGDLIALIGGGLTVDRPISLSGANSALTLEAGVGVAAGNATGGDVVLASPVATSNTGSIAIFSGHPDTTALSSMMSGATGVTQYKTYDAASSALSGTVAGTRNFYYRAAPALTVAGVTASKTYDGSTSAIGATAGGTVSGTIEGDAGYGIGDLTLAGASFGTRNVGTTSLSASYTAGAKTSGGWNVAGYTVDAYSAAGAGVIVPAPLTVISGFTTTGKIYDGTTDAAINVSGAQFGGLIAGDMLSIASASGAYGDPFPGVNKAVTVSGITLAGENAANYVLVGSNEAIYGDIFGRLPDNAAQMASAPGLPMPSASMPGEACASSSDTECAFRWPAREAPRENERIDATQSAESQTLELRSRGFSNSKILIRNRGIYFGEGARCRPGTATLCFSGVSARPMPRLARLDAEPETR